MIVRVLGQGQFDLDDARVDALNEIDDQLEQAVAGNDQAALTTALTALMMQVREHGRPVADDELAESELILPGPDATLADMHEMLGDSEEGLIPG